MASIKVFVHLAFDRFGGECLGRTRQYLEEVASSVSNTTRSVGSNEGERLFGTDGSNKPERHLYVWAGIGDPPGETSYWSVKYPVWDAVIPCPFDEEAAQLESPLDCPRDDIAKTLSSALPAQDNETGKAFRHLLSEKPVEILGKNAVFEVSVTATYAGAIPASSALFIGFLKGIAALRSKGVLHSAPQVFIGIGNDAAVSETGLNEETSRCLIANHIYELNDFVREFTDAATGAFPIYLIGDDKVAESSPDRDSQVSIGAMGVLASTRSIVFPAGPETKDPFRFLIDESGNVTWDNRPYDSKRPFAVLGAYAIRCPRMPLVRVLSARLCCDVMAALARQQSLGEDIETCSKTTPPDHIRIFIDSERNRIIESVWKHAAERQNIPWNDKEMAGVGWFPNELIRRMYGQVFEHRDWERITRIYTHDRLKLLPIEDWHQAITELEVVVEEGFIKRRIQRIKTVSRRILDSFLVGCEDALDGIFAKTFQEPVNLEPHRVAQAFLGDVFFNLEEAQVESTGQRSVEERKNPDRDGLSSARKSLEDSLSSVPSPIAVLLRLVPVTAMLSVVGLIVPDEILRLPPELKLAAGFGAGLLVSLAWWIVLVENVRRDLFRKFDRWLKKYEEVLTDEDKERESSEYESVLRGLKEIVKWLYEGGTEEPDLPQDLGMIRKREGPQVEPFVRMDDEETLRASTIMRFFSKHLKSAADRYKALQQTFVAFFQVSRQETLLPEIRPDDPSVLENEYTVLMKHFERDSEPGVSPILHFGRTLTKWLDDRAGLGPMFVPYRLKSRFEKDTTPGRPWQRTLLMLDEKELLSQEKRESSSGFLFFEAAVEHLRDTEQASFELAPRINDYVDSKGAMSFQATDLHQIFLSMGVPTVRVSGLEAVAYPIGCGRSDPFSDDKKGMGRISSTIKVYQGLGAGQIVFYPNSERPVNPLGLAWKTRDANLTDKRAFHRLSEASSEEHDQ